MRACACVRVYTCVCAYIGACMRDCERVLLYVALSVHRMADLACVLEGTATAAALTGVDWAAAAAEYLGSEGPKSHVASFPTRPTPFIQKMHRP